MSELITATVYGVGFFVSIWAMVCYWARFFLIRKELGGTSERRRSESSSFLALGIAIVATGAAVVFCREWLTLIAYERGWVELVAWLLDQRISLLLLGGVSIIGYLLHIYAPLSRKVAPKTFIGSVAVLVAVVWLSNLLLLR